MQGNIHAGSGKLFFTSGNTKYEVAELSDVNIDWSATKKDFKGTKQYTVASIFTDKKVGFKATTKVISPALFTAVTSGAVTVGLKAIQLDVKAASASVTVTPPSTGVFVADLGVLDNAGVPMKFNSGAPALGEYKNVAGVYTFNAGQTTGNLSISYIYSLATGSTATITNSVVSAAPTFSSIVYNDNLGVKEGFEFPAVVITKVGVSFKADDFSDQQIEVEAQADASGSIAYIYFA
jgi:hypothetical protein